ncbi:MAG: ribonuclease E/G [Clostridia bacterium]|nr:ribonuclease E/G [Clostridia bacterium]
MGNPYQLVICQDGETRKIALMEGAKLLEYHLENSESIVGSIIAGRVERVLPDIKAAFVRIGQPLNGFLPLKEAESYHRTMGNASLMSGQEILVQVKKAPKGGKGAFLTRDIALPGQYVLLMPCNRFVGLSKRIEAGDERARAKVLGETISSGRFGVIVRHAALFAAEEEVAQEAQQLWEMWQQLFEKALHTKAPAVMHTEPSVADVLIRDYSARHPMETLERTLEEWAFVENQAKAALGRRVDLPDGGSLVIDEREALQTIDVNSGRTVKATDGGNLAVEENLRAVPEIARQIRLRNLSGIILIDFIDMEKDSERELVMQAMVDALSDDRVKNVVHGFTRLGLLEMTRKRTSDSLRDALTVPCTACRETGRIL